METENVIIGLALVAGIYLAYKHFSAVQPSVTQLAAQGNLGAGISDSLAGGYSSTF